MWWGEGVGIGQQIEVKKCQHEKESVKKLGSIANIFHGWFLTRVALNTVLPKKILIGSVIFSIETDHKVK